MNLFHPQIAATLAATLSLAACVAPPAAPTIPVAPGPNKTSDRFEADQAACQQYAAAQISPAVAAARLETATKLPFLAARPIASLSVPPEKGFLRAAPSSTV